MFCYSKCGTQILPPTSADLFEGFQVYTSSVRNLRNTLFPSFPGDPESQARSRESALAKGATHNNTVPKGKVLFVALSYALLPELVK